MLYQMVRDFIISSIFRDLVLTSQQSSFVEMATYFSVVCIFVGIWKFVRGCFALWLK
ncbi:MAG: hypothetical protein RSB08_00405 [Clostridia bacterium]